MKQLPEGFTQFTHDGILFAYNKSTGEGFKWVVYSASKEAERKRVSRGCSGTSQWVALTPGTKAKAYTQVSISNSMQFWHRIVAQHFLNGGNPIPRELEVDHRKHANGTAYQDRLDNLRIVTRSGNAQNRQGGSSRFTGVSWKKSRNKWVADAHGRYLGIFRDELEAALAYIIYCKQNGLEYRVALEKLAA
jgi:hypothetical protein